MQHCKLLPGISERIVGTSHGTSQNPSLSTRSPSLACSISGGQSVRNGRRPAGDMPSEDATTFSKVWGSLENDRCYGTLWFCAIHSAKSKLITRHIVRRGLVVVVGNWRTSENSLTQPTSTPFSPLQEHMYLKENDVHVYELWRFWGMLCKLAVP